MSDPEPLVRGGPADQARKRRSIAIGLALAAFVALIFVTTMVRMGQNTAKGVQQRANPVPVSSVGG